MKLRVLTTVRRDVTDIHDDDAKAVDITVYGVRGLVQAAIVEKLVKRVLENVTEDDLQIAAKDP